MADHIFLNNKEEKRYELQAQGGIAIAEYLITEKGVIYITHTEVPSNLEGKGLASELIEKVLQNIEANNQKVFPLCPFASYYMNKYPEWKRLLWDRT